MIGPSHIVKQLARTSSKIGHSVIHGGSSIGSSISHSLSGSHSSRHSESSSSASTEPQYLLERLGGMVALKCIVQEFCRRVVQDPRLQHFFRGVDPRLLTAHQERFFSLAFTKVNVEGASKAIRTGHRRLWSQGLCQEHFDLFVQHLAATLKDRGFGEAIVQEALGILAPIREIFRQAAQEYKLAKVGHGRTGIAGSLGILGKDNNNNNGNNCSTGENSNPGVGYPMRT